MEYSDDRGSGASPFRKMRVRRGSPSRIAADTTDCPSGAQAGSPLRASESPRTLTCEPSLSIMYNCVRPLSSTEKATRRPSGAIDGPPMMRNCTLLQISRAAPCASDQMPCFSPRHDTYKRKSVPNRGATPFVKTSDGSLVGVAVGLSFMSDVRHILVWGLAIVATRWPPSAVAPSDE